MTLKEAEARAVDLSGLSAAHVAVSHPFALAAMTKIVMPRPSSSDDSELLAGRPERLVLWPHQRELLSMALAYRRVIILKARQLGITWAMALYALWYAMAHPNAEIVVVSIGEREARKVGLRIRWLYDHLPQAVRSAFPIGRKLSQLEFSIAHTAGDATITSLPSSSTAGRGETVNLLILDEQAHWEHADDRMASLLPTVEDIGQVIRASTANGIGDSFHRDYIEAPDNGWRKAFIAADARPDRDEEWVVAARARVPAGMGAQEYPMSEAEAFLSSGRCSFNTHALQDYLDNRTGAARRRGFLDISAAKVHFAPDERGPWRVWRWSEQGRQYLITADVCGGGGGTDYSSAGVWDIESWDQVASFHGRPEPTEFATQLIRAGWLWSANGRPALLAPETNDHGRAVITVCRERGYANLWKMQRYDQRRNVQVAQFGWLTTSASRPIMLGALKEAIVEGSLGIADSAIIGECLTFETSPTSGREEAREGCHDDRVMMAAIAAAVLIRVASGTHPRHVRPADLQPYRRPRSSRTSY